MLLVAGLLASIAAAAGGQAERGDAVAWAGFTTGFENRAPRDRIHVVSARVGEVFYMSELRGLEGRTVLHRWSKEERVAKEVRFEVDASRYRAVSRHKPGGDGSGTWTVEVVAASSGRVLHTDRLRYLPETPAPDEPTGRG